MQSSTSIRMALIVAVIFVPGSTQAADLAVLPGLMAGTSPKPAFGVVIGHAPSVAGFEIEYLGTTGRKTVNRSVAGGIFGNLIVQPVMVGRLQPFAIAGFGMWGETFENGGTGEMSARDIGGGIKVWLTDHLRLRLDYRLFLLGDADDGSRLPSTTRPRRISAGVHVAF